MKSQKWLKVYLIRAWKDSQEEKEVWDIKIFVDNYRKIKINGDT